MEIRADAVVTYPRELVFETYRDRLPELVPYLPNVDWIEVRSREEDGSVVKLVNEWKASTEIPRVMRKIVKPEMLRWKDFADWDQSSWTCAWRFELGFMKEQIRASGLNHMVEDGPDRARYEIRGTLEIDGSNIPGVPGLLGRKLAPQIEKFVVTLIRPNLVQVSDGVQRFLDARG